MFSKKYLSNVIRVISIDAIQRANSGHPGMPMGMADIADILWRFFLKHNPKNPLWDNRDRFILSNGHGSILLYSLLHLTGYKISISDLKNFRQLDSKTPGHPEVGYTPGIETTTGPLGQGLSTAIGMAISERLLRLYFNRPNFKIIDHYTWVFVGDGCLMEGISHEACSLAGTLGLEKLIVLYDKNNISIDGKTDSWFSDNTKKRFEAYNWYVIDNIDGHNSEEIFKAIKYAKKIKNKPVIIIFNTIIGFGSPNKANTSHVHGAPLGEEEVALCKKNLNWKYKPFEIPDFIYKEWDATEKGKNLEDKWNKLFFQYSNKYPKLAKEYLRRMHKKLPQDWRKINKNLINSLKTSSKALSTRQASQNIIEYLGKYLPELIGGSADLSPSNLTKWSGSKSINKNLYGNYIHYGVREFGMTSIANGISQHSGFIPYTATFLIFLEYAKNAVRMAALMKTRQILIYTHDSIGLGEDGPTHQPIEQISSLRLTPNVSVWRPSDIIETAFAWKYAIENQNGPTALILSRQNLSFNNRTDAQIKNINRGGYILKDSLKDLDIILISTGSEIELTVNVRKKLKKLGYSVRVVSMPSTDVFDKQEKSYRKYVLPDNITNRISIEAGIPDYWNKYIGLKGKTIGIKTFGESAPANDLFKKFGFTVKNIVHKAVKLIKKNHKSV
ncbi:transketolase [Buchnera aphidicola]|uniref:transketolase n=1 Tax=Buchnera aphidicola TaxID=9 RepID=UPI002237FDEC|nr:transketolase [Buchnera aphidicola]MCW5197600.1 transketolase [Buchnera aphidicola (Chaitophorus viminalis)]